MAELRLSFPVTVAGLFRTFTGFPILLTTTSDQPPVTAGLCTPRRIGVSRIIVATIVWRAARHNACAVDLLEDLRTKSDRQAAPRFGPKEVKNDAVDPAGQ